MKDALLQKKSDTESIRGIARSFASVQSWAWGSLPELRTERKILHVLLIRTFENGVGDPDDICTKRDKRSDRRRQASEFVRRRTVRSKAQHEPIADATGRPATNARPTDKFLPTERGYRAWKGGSHSAYSRLDRLTSLRTHCLSITLES